MVLERWISRSIVRQAGSAEGGIFASVGVGGQQCLSRRLVDRCILFHAKKRVHFRVQVGVEPSTLAASEFSGRCVAGVPSRRPVERGLSGIFAVRLFFVLFLEGFDLIDLIDVTKSVNVT